MKNYFHILRLDLRMQLGFLNPKNWKANIKGADNRMLRQVFGILVLLLVFGGYAAYLEWMGVDYLMRIQSDPRMLPVNMVLSRQGLTLPHLLLVLVVMVSMLLTFFYGLFQLLASLYFAKDINFFAALPIRSREVYAAKFTMVWLSESGVTALFILPLTVIFLIRQGFDGFLLLRAILLTFLIPVLPLAVCAFLVGLIARLSGFWKHRDAITMIGTFVLIIVQMTLSFSLSSVSSSIEPNLSSVTEFLINLLSGRTDIVEMLTRLFPPAYWAAKGLVGDWGNLALVLLTDGIAIALLLYCMGPGYLREVGSSSETHVSGRKINFAKASYKSHSRLSAIMQLEFRQILRSPTYLTNTLMGSVFVPILMTVGMVIGFGSALDWNFDSILQEVFGSGHDYTIIAGAFALLLSFMGGMNMASATSVSREGSRHGLIRSLPLKGRDALRAKMLLGFLFAVTGLIIPCLALLILVPSMWFSVLETFFWSAALCYIFSCMGVIVDSMRPKLHWNNENDAMKQNFNSVICMVAGILILAIFGFLAFFLLTNDIYGTALALIVSCLLLIFAVGFRLLLNWAADKRYDQIEG